MFLDLVVGRGGREEEHFDSKSKSEEEDNAEDKEEEDKDKEDYINVKEDTAACHGVLWKVI